MVGNYFIAGFFIGGAVGLCFRSWALVPIMTVAICGVVTFSLLHDTAALAALRAVTIVLAAQVGYVSAFVGRYLTIIARVPVKQREPDYKEALSRRS